MTLEYTAVTEIPSRVNKVKEAFHTRKFDPAQTRLNALRNLYYMIVDNEDRILKALTLDLNRTAEESRVIELDVVLADLLYAIENLESWMKDEKPKDVPWLFVFSHARVQNIPLGTILVIGTFNYPVLLSLGPVIGAIAAGNTVVLKQSENSPNVSAVLTDLLEEHIDNELLKCVNGGVEETSALLNIKFDKVFYTGSGTVGKIVAKACAEQLTPCVLELGGKNPAFVTSGCKNLDLAAKRIVNARFMNSGQTCVAVEYCLVEDYVYDEFVDKLVKWTKKLYGDATPETYTKIVNERNVDRILGILKDTKGQIVYGGTHSASDHSVMPTVINNVAWDDASMHDEIFGPVLPVLKYSSLNSAIGNVIRYHDTPLALYAFTDDNSEVRQITSRVRSGAFVQNDAVMHVSVAQIPFGGIGSSGYGNYHGRNSFKTFSHERAVLKQPWWTEALLEARYRPILKFDAKLARFASLPRTRFGRHGKVGNFRRTMFWVIIGTAAILGLFFGYKGERDHKWMV